MPLETDHKTFFWKYPINYREIERNSSQNIGDNDHNTSDVANSVTIDVSNNGFTHLFLKTMYADDMTLDLDGTSRAAFDFPNTILNSSNRYVRIDSDGFQNILFRVNSDGSREENVSQLTINLNQIPGQSSCIIYEAMVLDQALIMSADRRFTNISYKLADRSSVIQKDIADRVTKIPGINNDRWKWDVDYKTTFRGDELNPFQQDGTLIPGSELHIDNLDGMLYNRLINFIRDRTNNNFCFSGEYTRYPERVYPATFPNPDMLLAFLSDFKASGEEIEFTIIEL